MGFSFRSKQKSCPIRRPANKVPDTGWDFFAFPKPSSITFSDDCQSGVPARKLEGAEATLGAGDMLKDSQIDQL
jgi:hypothetical protein